MNYIAEINAFYEWLIENPISGNTQALWHRLMAYCNAFGWKEQFTITNGRLVEDLDISRQELDRVRNTLCQKGLISYKKGNGNSSGIYHINNFVSHNVTQSGQKAGTSVAQSGQGTLPLNKLNETKQNLSPADCIGGESESPLPKETDGGEKSESVRESKVIEIGVHAEFEKAYKAYPRKEGKSEGKKLYLAYLINGREIKGQPGKVRFNHAQLRMAIMEFARQMESDERERDKIKHFDTFMNAAVIDYVENSAEAYEAAMLATYGEDWQSLKFEYNLKK